MQVRLDSTVQFVAFERDAPPAPVEVLTDLGPLLVTTRIELNGIQFVAGSLSASAKSNGVYFVRQGATGELTAQRLVATVMVPQLLATMNQFVVIDRVGHAVGTRMWIVSDLGTKRQVQDLGRLEESPDRLLLLNGTPVLAGTHYADDGTPYGWALAVRDQGTLVPLDCLGNGEAK